MTALMKNQTHMFARRFVWVALLLLLAMAPSACRSVSDQTDEVSGVTTRMREACPALSDEVLDAFVLAISSLRNDGLSESDAVTKWVQGCAGIPPDGNFQGDTAACRTCLPVIVEDVYEAAGQ